MSNVKIRVLFVDDEQRVIEQLRRSLAPMQPTWSAFFAHNGFEALELLERQPVDVLVTDFQMPGMDGAALLTTVMHKYPQVIRYMLADQQTHDDVYQTIGPTQQFLLKSCPFEILRDSIERALMLRRRLYSDSLLRIVGRIGVLPSLPARYLEVTQALADSNISLSAIGKTIEQDLGMSAKVLQLVNSAFFGLPIKVTSPTQAVCLLGLDIVKSLAAWFHVGAQLQGFDTGGLSFNTLQQHSLRVSGYVREIAATEELEKHETDELITAGLFHDIGKLILAANLPDRYAHVLQRVADLKLPLFFVEETAFGASHADIGAYLMALWGFTDSVVEACCYHHNPQAYTGYSFKSLCVVFAADAIDEELEHPERNHGKPMIDFLSQYGLEKRIAVWRTCCAALRESARHRPV